MERKEEYEAKVILLGESGVGKTSIIKRYLCEDFDPNEQSNLSMNYVEKQLEMDHRKVRLNIWDTIGQEKYRSLSKLFLNDTKIIILVYSIDSKKSFDELNYWYQLYSEQLGNDIILGIAGNKCDLFLREEVPEEKGREYAKSHNAAFALLSAKENKESIDLFMEKLINIYLKKVTNEPNANNKNNNFSLKTLEYKGNNQKNSGCCSGNNKIRQKRYELINKNKGYLEVIFLGGNNVGKTSLIKRIIKNEFNPNEDHTDHLVVDEIKYTNQTIAFVVKIYDIDNEQKKKNESVNAIKNSNIFFLVFDINNKKSYFEICSWIEVIKRCKKNDKNYLIVIIANKIDLHKDIDKNKNEYIDKAKKLANDNQGIFFITSASNGEGIKNLLGDSINNYLLLS